MNVDVEGNPTFLSFLDKDLTTWDSYQTELFITVSKDGNFKMFPRKITHCSTILIVTKFS